jgi:hypothetical protein
VKEPAPRFLALLLTALLAVCLVGAQPASASRPAQERAGLKAGLGGAHIAKRNKPRRARASRRRRQATAKAKAKTTPAENSAVLFRGDFDPGFGSWHVQSLSSRATLFSTGAFQGTQAARFEVQPGDVEPETGSQRSEVSGPTFDEGQDLYIRDAIRVPASNSYSGDWQIIQQLHEENWSSSPGMAVFLDDDRALALGTGDGSQTFWQSAALQSDRWYDLVYRVNLSQDPGVGFVEVWLDGTQQSLENGQSRLYGQTIQAAQTYLKAGVYRSKSGTGTSVVEHDGIVVGTSYAAVATG